MQYCATREGWRDLPTSRGRVKKYKPLFLSQVAPPLDPAWKTGHAWIFKDKLLKACIKMLEAFVKC